MAQILQGLSYKACSAMSPKFFAFGLFVIVLEISCYKLFYLRYFTWFALGFYFLHFIGFPR